MLGGLDRTQRDVEDVAKHPDVSMAAVVGRPDERLGEEVVGFVALDAGGSVTGAELVAFCRERLAAHTYPPVVGTGGALRALEAEVPVCA
jgi:long-chain acyl-CoA synthetase